MVGYLFPQLTGGFAVADVVVLVGKVASLLELIIDKFTSTIISKVPCYCRCSGIPGIPALGGAHQVIVLLGISGQHVASPGILIADGGQEVEPGMVSILADHAVGIG